MSAASATNIKYAWKWDLSKGLNWPVQDRCQRCRCRVLHPWGWLEVWGGGTGSGRTFHLEPNEPPGLMACCPPVVVRVKVTTRSKNEGDRKKKYEDWLIGIDRNWQEWHLAVKLSSLVSLNTNWVLRPHCHSRVICTFDISHQQSIWDINIFHYFIAKIEWGSANPLLSEEGIG